MTKQVQQDYSLDTIKGLLNLFWCGKGQFLNLSELNENRENPVRLHSTGEEISYIGLDYQNKVFIITAKDNGIDIDYHLAISENLDKTDMVIIIDNLSELHKMVQKEDYLVCNDLYEQNFMDLNLKFDIRDVIRTSKVTKDKNLDLITNSFFTKHIHKIVGQTFSADNEIYRIEDIASEMQLIVRELITDTTKCVFCFNLPKEAIRRFAWIIRSQSNSKNE